MIVLYSIVFIVALVSVIVCCFFIVRDIEDVDRSDAYKYDADDYLTLEVEECTSQHQKP